MIRILWPTIRPKMMKETYAWWLAHAKNPDDVCIKIAVNTPEEREQLSEFEDVMVVGTEQRGSCFAVQKLTSAISGDPRDIVILCSDDFYAPQDWDVRLHKEFEDFNGALLVYDGIQMGDCMTIPILRYSCLTQKLNRILNHPSYRCFRADRELYTNLNELKLIKNLRHDKAFRFEHRHWSTEQRKKDENDEYGLSVWELDNLVYQGRMVRSLQDRLRL